MVAFRCPGQDKRFWKPEDISESPCTRCGKMIEFWKDEPRLKCRRCGETIMNPKLGRGCAKWCKFATDCIGEDTEIAQ